MRGSWSTISKFVVKWSYLALLGVLGFGMLGLHFVINVLHFPFFFIEWVYIPIILIYGNGLISIVKKLNVYHVILVILTVYGMTSYIIRTGSFAIISDYRSMIYLFIAYRYFKSKGLSNWLNYFLYVCLFSTAGELSYILFFSNSRIVSSTNCLASSVAIIGFFVIGNYGLGFIAFLLSLLIGIMSGYRIGIIFSVLSLIIASIYSVTHYKGDSRNKIIRKFIYLGIVIVVLVTFFMHYEEIITILSDMFQLDQFAVFRVTTRMKAIFQMDFSQSQDGDRLELWAMAIQEFTRSILPRGYIKAPGIYIDVPILILYDTYGSIVSCMLIFYLIKQFLVLIIKVHKYKSYYSTDMQRLFEFSIYTVPVLLGLFLSNGTFLKNVYQAIMVGVILGGLAYAAKNNFKKH